MRQTDRVPTLARLSVGTSPLGGNVQTYGYDVGERVAVDTVRRLLDSPIRALDTSNQYSGGESERRIGRAIEESGGLPDDFMIATKADPLPDESCFTGGRVHRSFRESTERLGGSRFGVYYLHDPEWFEFDTMIGSNGAVAAMRELRDDGLVDAIGVAGGDLDEMRRYVDLGVFDVILNHNRYTLLDRSADALIDHAIECGTSFVNAAPYASGILARPASASPIYQYRAPSPEILTTTQRLREACDRRGIPLQAVALQFSSRDARISSTVVGVSSPRRVDELVANDRVVVPDDLWTEVGAIIDADLSHLSN